MLLSKFIMKEVNEERKEIQLQCLMEAEIDD